MKLSRCIAGAVLALGLVGGTRADAATFASFSFVGPTKFSLNGAGVFSVSTVVNFNYVANVDVAVPDTLVHSADLVILGSLTPGTGVSVLGTKLQPGSVASFSITGNDAGDLPYFGFNLLSGSSSGIIMAGSAASGGINTTQPPDSVAFTSDFILPSGFGNERSWSWSLTDVSPVFALTGALNIRAFDSSISGVFAASPVPEPGTMAMLVGMGVAGSLVALRRKRA